VRIDVCPTCHGVWLDAGELEMVLHLPRPELLRAVAEVGSGTPSK
jgi:Zn-finger nucleic acid-binding protein